MARQSIFEQLATCSIGINGSAQSVVSQSGCSQDEQLTPKEQYANLVNARHRVELILKQYPKGWHQRSDFVQMLNDINGQQAALRKQYPKLSRKR